MSSRSGGVQYDVIVPRGALFLFAYGYRDCVDLSGSISASLIIICMCVHFFGISWTCTDGRKYFAAKIGTVYNAKTTNTTTTQRCFVIHIYGETLSFVRYLVYS